MPASTWCHPCALCALCSAVLHDTPEEFNSANGNSSTILQSTRAVPYSATIGLSTILQSRVNNGTRPELYSANGKCSAVQSVQFCIHQNSELNWSLHNITEPHSANGNSSTMLQSEEWYRTSANGNLSTMLWRMVQDQCKAVQMATPPQWVWSYVDAATKAVYGDRQFWLVAMLHSNINERQKWCIHPSTLKY